jgi:hypothetical protein
MHFALEASFDTSGGMIAANDEIMLAKRMLNIGDIKSWSEAV